MQILVIRPILTLFSNVDSRSHFVTLFEAGPRDEFRLVEKLTTSEEESGESQGLAKVPTERQAPTAPDIPDAQLRDENIAPILIAKLHSNDKPKLEEILGASENVKKL